MTAILHSSIRIMTPFLFAAIGGLFSEAAGILNIGLEGLMLISAFFCVTAAGFSGSLWVGIAAGVSAAMALAMIFAYASIRLKANIFIAGIATNLVAAALSALLASHIFGHRGVFRFSNFPTLPLVAKPSWIGWPGDILLGHNVLVYLSWLTAAACAIVLYKTPLGLRIRGTGLDSRTMVTLGLRPNRYRFAGVLVSGFTCGLAGCFLSLSLAAYVPNLTAGRGWIALVIIYLGFRKPLGIVIASLLFGVAESLSNYSQGFLSLPPEIIMAFPYIISIVALVGYSAWGYYRRVK